MGIWSSTPRLPPPLPPKKSESKTILFESDQITCQNVGTELVNLGNDEFLFRGQWWKKDSYETVRLFWYRRQHPTCPLVELYSTNIGDPELVGKSLPFCWNAQERLVYVLDRPNKTFVGIVLLSNGSFQVQQHPTLVLERPEKITSVIWDAANQVLVWQEVDSKRMSRIDWEGPSFENSIYYGSPTREKIHHWRSWQRTQRGPRTFLFQDTILVPAVTGSSNEVRYEIHRHWNSPTNYVHATLKIQTGTDVGQQRGYPCLFLDAAGHICQGGPFYRALNNADWPGTFLTLPTPDGVQQDCIVHPPVDSHDTFWESHAYCCDVWTGTIYVLASVSNQRGQDTRWQIVSLDDCKVIKVDQVVEDFVMHVLSPVLSGRPLPRGIQKMIAEYSVWPFNC